MKEVKELQIIEVNAKENRLIGNCIVEDQCVGFSLPIVGNGRSSFYPKPYLQYRDEIRKQVSKEIEKALNYFY